MEIIWHGHSCFTLKGKDATVILDPYNGLGDKLPKFKGDILIQGDVLAREKGELAPVDGEPKHIDWPGEFEVSGVAIEGFSADQHAKEGGQEGENVHLYVVVVDGIKVCHLSGLSHELSTELLERIGDVDVLLLPVGGGPVLTGKRAYGVMESVEPRVVIPSYFAATNSELGIGGAEEFLKEAGKGDLAPETSFKVSSRSSLPDDNTEIILLEPKLG